MAMFEENREDGSLIVVTGKTRSGKTVWTSQQVADAQRLLVWDAMAQWGNDFNCRAVTTWADLAECCKSTALNERIAFQCPVTRENFEVFCSLAMISIKMRVSVLVIEEIADVSSPAKASQNWGELIRKGLRYQPTIYALSQRPQESDKTMLNMASKMHCHCIGFGPDQKYIADNLLGVPVERVAALKPLEFLEKDLITNTVTAGVVSFQGEAGTGADLPPGPAKKKQPAKAKIKKTAAKSPKKRG